MEYLAPGLGQFDHDLGNGYTPSLNVEGCLHVVEKRAYDLRRGCRAEAPQRKRFRPATRAQRPDIIDRVTKTLLADDPATHAAIWDVISTLNIHTRLWEIRCPTLILVGAHDPSTPPSVARGLSEAIWGAKMTVIPDASQIVTVEAPAAVNDALEEFLNSLED
jgi:pimeloyl-ACP methyl ester carboxylesterase